MRALRASKRHWHMRLDRQSRPKLVKWSFQKNVGSEIMHLHGLQPENKPSHATIPLSRESVTPSATQLLVQLVPVKMFNDDIYVVLTASL